MQLRKNQTLERFHEFLKQENEIGNKIGQEAVSMVPSLFLNVSLDHSVLDMSAVRFWSLPLIMADPTSCRIFARVCVEFQRFS